MLDREHANSKARTLTDDDYRQIAIESHAQSPYWPILDSRSFIRSFDTIQPGDKVAILCRVTTKEQERNGSLDSQVRFLRQAVRERGGIPIVRFQIAGVSADSAEWFRRLPNVCREFAARGATKVAISDLSRLVRPPDFRYDRFALPTAEQLQMIRELLDSYGLTIVCWLDLIATPAEVRSFQTKLSGRAGRPMGRLTKRPGVIKRRRERYKHMALDLVDSGHSYRETRDLVNAAMEKDRCLARKVSHETIRKWQIASGGNGSVT
jgi:hypothetical protein